MATLHATTRVTAADRARTKHEVRAVFGKYDRSGDGFIDQAELAQLLRDLRGRQPSKNDVLFALRAVDVSDDGRISFAEMCKYWEKFKVGHGGAKLNKLLVRDLVGSVRTSSYDLPPSEHSFGGKMSKPEDKIGTRQVLEDWQVSRYSSTRTRRAKPTVAAGAGAAATVDRSASMGRTSAVRPGTPMDAIIKNEFGNATAKDVVYPEKPRRVRKDVPVARTTGATIARMEATRSRVSEQAAPPTGTWKMKKFTKVKSRIVI